MEGPAEAEKEGPALGHCVLAAQKLQQAACSVERDTVSGLGWEFRAGLCRRICLQCGRPGFNPWVGKIPWRKEWQPTPVFLPGESHGQRSLVGYSPWGHKESDMTE